MNLETLLEGNTGRLTAVLTAALLFIIIVGISNFSMKQGYAEGWADSHNATEMERQEKIVASNAYEAFNASLEAYKRNNTEEARALVDSANSHIWTIMYPVLNQNNHDGYKAMYGAVLTQCQLNDYGDKCDETIQLVMQQIKPKTKYAANETATTGT